MAGSDLTHAGWWSLWRPFIFNSYPDLFCWSCEEKFHSAMCEIFEIGLQEQNFLVLIKSLKMKLWIEWKICNQISDKEAHKIYFTAPGFYRDHPPAWELTSRSRNINYQNLYFDSNQNLKVIIIQKFPFLAKLCIRNRFWHASLLDPVLQNRFWSPSGKKSIN